MSFMPILKGAYDLHVHAGPDVMPRKCDDFELAERTLQSGMKGCVLKSHYFCTAERARVVNKAHPGINMVGAVSLNNAVGGLNWVAVEMAARAGAKIVWMPTVDADNEQEHFRKHKPEKLPYWAKVQLELAAKGKMQDGISILAGGQLKPEVVRILDIIAEYNMILATGHLGRTEVFALVKAARERNVKNIIVSHPDFPSTALTKEEQKELAQLGAYMEHCFWTVHSGKTSWDQVYEQIKFVGTDKCVISTDLGQATGMYPDEGLQMFVSNLLKNGFSESDIKKMVVKNPAYLVEG